MLRHSIFCLLVLFAVYVISTDTAGAADLTVSFFEWIGQGVDGTRDFVQSTFGDAPVTTLDDDAAPTP